MVRVRFAPSPTGPLHIGGLRTALFNYLFAKKHNGKFILRIENTDQNRYVENSENHIFDSLTWCDINIDESINSEGEYGPYKQSLRKNIYQKYIYQLIEKDFAYYAFDTSEELENYRKSEEKNGHTFMYGQHNRESLNNSLKLPQNVIKEKIENEPYVIRFKIPKNETVKIDDIVRGKIKFKTNLLDDKVLFKSDGLPTYHFANIVDDYLMKISHVIRGEEWLPSVGLHQLLYKAFGWTPPLFAHLPLILKPSGKGKLSKRDGDKLGIPVFAVPFFDKDSNSNFESFQNQGYNPKALINFLAFLGWHPNSDKEIYTIEELINDFDLKNINSAGSKFDIEKLTWFNQQHLQLESNKNLAKAFQNQLNQKNISKSLDELEYIVSLIKERAVFSKDFWELSYYLFENPITYNQKAKKKCFKEHTAQYLNHIVNIIKPMVNKKSIDFENNIKQWMTDENISIGQIMQPLRLAIVGDLKGIHLFDIIELIGVENSIERIHHFIADNA